MLTASVVLPIEGRPAMMIRSPGRRPPVFLSKSVKPVASPRNLSGLVCHSSILSIRGGSNALTRTAPDPSRVPCFDQRAQQRTLAHDARVGANVGGGGSIARQGAEIGKATGVLETRMP